VSKHSMVLALQREALKSDVSVASLLRNAKVIAAKLSLDDALVWINRELDGYPNALVKDLPEYRRLRGRAKAWNPYRGWLPIESRDAKVLEYLSFAPIGQAMGAIEHGLEKDIERGGVFTFPYPPEMRVKVQNAINDFTDVHIEIDPGQIRNIVDQVRNLVLNWTIELEKAGIRGEEMTFSSEEKMDAPKANQNFFIQNVGVLGNVSGQASVHNQQTGSNLDIQKIKDLLAQSAAIAGALPEATRNEMQPVLSSIQTEIARPEPDQGKLAEMLSSVRKVCEGATGSLAAQGIVQLIKIIFGA